MQYDGNLVVYGADNAPLWSSATAGKPGAWVVIQSDSNFVVYGSGGALWASNAGGGSPTRDAMVVRAQSWINEKVGYSTTSSHTNVYGTYRADCSGYVSMIWALSKSYVTNTLPQVSHSIAKADLVRGDVLLNTATGSSGHVVLFDSWANAAHTAYNGYEENPYWGGAHYTTNMTYPYWPGYGTYNPYRLNGL
jgi:hypothetical protein